MRRHPGEPPPGWHREFNRGWVELLEVGEPSSLMFLQRPVDGTLEKVAVPLRDGWTTKISIDNTSVKCQIDASGEDPVFSLCVGATLTCALNLSVLN